MTSNSSIWIICCRVTFLADPAGAATNMEPPPPDNTVVTGTLLTSPVVSPHHQPSPTNLPCQLIQWMKYLFFKQLQLIKSRRHLLTYFPHLLNCASTDILATWSPTYCHLSASSFSWHIQQRDIARTIHITSIHEISFIELHCNATLLTFDTYLTYYSTSSDVHTQWLKCANSVRCIHMWHNLCYTLFNISSTWDSIPLISWRNETESAERSILAEDSEEDYFDIPPPYDIQTGEHSFRSIIASSTQGLPKTLLSFTAI